MPHPFEQKCCASFNLGYLSGCDRNRDRARWLRYAHQRFCAILVCCRYLLPVYRMGIFFACVHPLAYFLFGPNVIGGSILSAVPESMSDSRRNAVLAEAIADDAGGDTASLSNAEALSINLAKSRLHRLLDRVNFLKQLGIFLPGRHRTSTGRKNWRLTATGVALFIIYIGGSFGTPLVLLTMINRLHYDQRQSGEHTQLHQSFSMPTMIRRGNADRHPRK